MQIKTTDLRAVKRRVRITKVGQPTYWYNGLVGEEFEVYYCAQWKEYIVAEDFDLGLDTMWRHIPPGECEEVEDAE